MDDTRLTRVEEKIAHLEKLVDDLNGVVRELGDQLEAHRRAVTSLRSTTEKLIDSQGEAPRSLEDDRPPHW